MTVALTSNTKSVNKAIKYIRDGIDKETGEKKCVALKGINVDPLHAEAQFLAVRRVYEKEGGRQGKLYIQSFGEDLEPSVALEIAEETHKRFFKKVGFNTQTVLSVHGNTDTVHVHSVSNTVDFETGKKFRVPHDLKLFREISDEVSLEYGIKPPVAAPVKETFAEKKMRERNPDKYMWKDDLRARIEASRDQSASFKEFEEDLAENGVVIRLRDKGKKITYVFKDKEEKQRQIRHTNLGTRYSPESIENQLYINQVVSEEREREKRKKQKEVSVNDVEIAQNEPESENGYWYNVNWSDSHTNYNLLAHYEVIAFGENDNIVALSSEIIDEDLESLDVKAIEPERPLTEEELELLHYHQELERELEEINNLDYFYDDDELEL